MPTEMSILSFEGIELRRSGNIWALFVNQFCALVNSAKIQKKLKYLKYKKNIP